MSCFSLMCPPVFVLNIHNVQYVYMHFGQCCTCLFYCNNTSTNTTSGIVCRRDIIDVITTIPMAGKSDLSFRNVAAGWEGKFQPWNPCDNIVGHTQLWSYPNENDIILPEGTLCSSFTSQTRQILTHRLPNAYYCFFFQNTQFLMKKVPFIRDLEIRKFDGSWDKLKNSSIPKIEPLHAKAAEKITNMLSPKPVRTAIVYLVRRHIQCWYATHYTHPINTHNISWHT